MLNQIKAIINEAETMRNAFFFTHPGNARMRREYEKKHSHAPITWEEGGNTYTAAFRVDCSCKNVYAHGTYTKNGNKTTLTAIKNSYARMEKTLI